MKPQLKFVTMTGADDLVKPRDLYLLSQKYPFVEWAFLMSRTRTGLEPRYPSLKWLSEVSNYDINKAVHLCGSRSPSPRKPLALAMGGIGVMIIILIIFIDNFSK